MSLIYEVTIHLDPLSVMNDDIIQVVYVKESCDRCILIPKSTMLGDKYQV